MSTSDSGLRRVSVHAGTSVVDLSLPAGIPVATLIPQIVDVLNDRDRGNSGGSSDDLMARRYQLSLPGAPALDASMTLEQQGIPDGAVMMLSHARTPLPPPRYDDVAEAVSATLAATARPGERHGESLAGLTLCLIGTGFAAVAGFLAVPGPPGVANVLLAAMTAAVASVSAMRAPGCGGITLTALSCFAMVVALAALVGVVSAAPPHVIGSVTALVSLGLLGVSARASILLAGLSPRLDVETAELEGDRLAVKVIRADNWLTSLFAAFSSSAAFGAVVTVLAGAPRLSRITFGWITAALLLLYARSVEGKRAVMFVVTGMVTTGTTFAVTAAVIRQPWITALALVVAAAAIYLGFVAATTSPLPTLGIELLECVALVAMVPLTCWICGLYGSIRGLNPT